SSTIAGRLSGTVTRPDGTTAAGAGVEVTVSGPLPDIKALTNGAGEYAFPEILPQGRWVMTVRDPVAGGLAQDLIYLQAGQDATHDVRLRGTGTVVVHVVDGAGRLAENAHVELRQSEYPFRAYEGHVRAEIDDGA